MPYQNNPSRPQTSRQAKRAFQKRGGRPLITEAERKQNERRAELLERAARIKAHNIRARENKRKREERQAEAREARKKQGLPEPSKIHIGPSQTNLGDFVGAGNKKRKEIPDNSEQNKSASPSPAAPDPSNPSVPSPKYNQNCAHRERSISRSPSKSTSIGRKQSSSTWYGNAVPSRASSLACTGPPAQREVRDVTVPPMAKEVPCCHSQADVERKAENIPTSWQSGHRPEFVDQRKAALVFEVPQKSCHKIDEKSKLVDSLRDSARVTTPRRKQPVFSAFQAVRREVITTAPVKDEQEHTSASCALMPPPPARVPLKAKPSLQNISLSPVARAPRNKKSLPQAPALAEMDFDLLFPSNTQVEREISTPKQKFSPKQPYSLHGLSALPRNAPDDFLAHISTQDLEYDGLLSSPAADHIENRSEFGSDIDDETLEEIAEAVESGHTINARNVIPAAPFLPR